MKENNLLISAIKNKNFKKAEKIIKTIDLNSSDEDRLYYMIYTEGYPKLQSLLIENGMKLNYSEEHYENGHSLAFYASTPDILDLTIIAGNEIRIHPEISDKIITAQDKTKNIDNIIHLIKKYNDIPNIESITKKIKTIDDIKKIDNIGLNIFKEDNAEQNLLFIMDDEKSINYLIKVRGFNVNKKDSKNLNTALHTTKNLGKIEILLNNGANINALNKYGNNFIMEQNSLLEDDKFNLDFYIRKGLNINQVNKNNDNILSFININKNKKIFSMLIEYGVDYNIYGKNITEIIDNLAKKNLLEPKESFYSYIDMSECYEKDKNTYKEKVDEKKDILKEIFIGVEPSLRKNKESSLKM